MAAIDVTPSSLPLAIADWSHVARAVFRIEQSYSYAYSEPVRHLHHRLRVVPPDVHGDQHLLVHDLRTCGPVDESSVVWSEDPFGNRVCTIEAPQVDDCLKFDVQFLVERCAAEGAPGARSIESLSDGDLLKYLESTPLTEPSLVLARVAARIEASSAWPRGRAYRAYHWAAAALTYRPGETDVATIAAEAMALGAGVCQDFTHVLLTVLRLMGIPARYVSGHLLGDGAPHAWVEALFPDEQVPGATSIVAYDPTNRREPGLTYVTVAVGRDYADVTPTSGWFVGPAKSRFEARQQVELVEVGYRSS